MDNEHDPTLEKGENDESSVKITLAIVLTAFIISPMTECLGPVLELNVSQKFQVNNYGSSKLKIQSQLGTASSNSIGIYPTWPGVHSNGTTFND